MNEALAAIDFWPLFFALGLGIKEWTRSQAASLCRTLLCVVSSQDQPPSAFSVRPGKRHVPVRTTCPCSCSACVTPTSESTMYRMVSIGTQNRVD